MICEKYVLVLCGHRDDQTDFVEHKEQKAGNPGNFVELVRFRTQTDDVLRIYLVSAQKN